MEESAVLEKINILKDSVIEFKIKYKDLQEKYNQLKNFSDNVQIELEKTKSQNGIYKRDIEKLQDQLNNIQKQNQQIKETGQAAKDAFMQELTRAMNEASEALKE